jgi:hypothetical protein
MCNVCRYWLGKTDAQAKACNGKHYCGVIQGGVLCRGSIREGLPSWIGCTRGHGSVGLVVLSEKEIRSA